VLLVEIVTTLIQWWCLVNLFTQKRWKDAYLPWACCAGAIAIVIWAALSADYSVLLDGIALGTTVVVILSQAAETLGSAT
jgi:hypothetical protein